MCQEVVKASLADGQVLGSVAPINKEALIWRNHSPLDGLFPTRVWHCRCRLPAFLTRRLVYCRCIGNLTIPCHLSPLVTVGFLIHTAHVQ